MIETTGRGKIYDRITDTFGNTPIVRLNQLAEANGVKADILLKLEFFNPLSSVKDRIGIAMIEDLESKGLIKEDTVLVEPTSGNTGIALAFTAAAKGIKMILCMPESMSIERRKMLAFLGAKLELTPAAEGMKGAIARAEAIARDNPNAIIPQQFSNPSNPEIHKNTTAQEIWNDTEGNIDVLIAGVGTGGTLTGISSVIKEKKSDLHVVAVEPEDSAVISGNAPGPHKIQGIGAGFIPDNLQKDFIDEVITIGNETAFETARNVAKSDGIPVGISSGAAIAAALEIGSRDDMAGKQIVVIIPSTSERYLTTALFDGV